MSILMPARVLAAPPPPPPGSRDHMRQRAFHSSPLKSPVKQEPAEMVDVDMAAQHGRSTAPNGTTNHKNRSNEFDGEEVDMSMLDDEDEDSDSDDDDDYDQPMAPVVHVEVRLSDESRVIGSVIESNVLPMLRQAYEWVPPATLVPEKYWADIPVLGKNVAQIYIAECDASVEAVTADFRIHTYSPSDRPVTHITGGLDEDEDDSRTSAATICELPSRLHEGLWDSLVYPDDIKEKLLTYIHSTSLFAENEVDFNVISWNRLILLYGPPGTGKTSLCRALAQKLSIRMSETYSHGRLVEINSHSLFSKWFSESGKLVQKLFDDVTDLAEDDECLVVVMIDEVESLTAARLGAMNGNEPSDALRVVNALLTQLDKLKSRKNVLVMTTSNLAGSIDSAFVDRADIKQYVGLPPVAAIYWILSSCLQALGEADLAPGAKHLLKWSDCILADSALPPTQKKRVNRARQASYKLRRIAERCHELELSGRFLRKVPVMAHARYLAGRTGGRASLDQWMEALGKAVEDERLARELVNQAEGKHSVKSEPKA